MTAEHAVTILIEPSLVHGVQILPGLLAETIVKLFFVQLSHLDGDLFLILWTAGVQYGPRPRRHPDHRDVFGDWSSIQTLRRHAG